MKTLKIVVILCALILLLCGINHWIFKIGYGIPGGEINFIGLTKQEVVKKLQEEGIDSFIFVDGYKGRSYKNTSEIEADPWVMKSNLWGVNCKHAGCVTYIQILFFDRAGNVYKQKVSYSFDGP